MRKLLFILVSLFAVAALAQQRTATENTSFASNFQTVPVMANNAGIGGGFQTYVTLLNPTSSPFTIDVALYDGAGTKRTASIALAARELKTYDNFLLEVFNYTGGGAVTFRSGDSNQRFIVSTEVRTTGTRYSTTVPALEFAGSNSRSFAAGVTVDSSSRTNVGCFNQSDAANAVAVTVYDKSGAQNLGTATLNLAANGWGQINISAIVSGGYVVFDPQEAAVCYASVVDNTTNDARFISAAEYRP